MENKCKILISYHKPSSILESDVFVPIHVGRAVAKEEVKNSLANIKGDDTGENISEKNRNYCELTSQYWAWKNYEKLENPEFIGFMHYRRHLNFNETKNFPENKWGLIERENLDDFYTKDFKLDDTSINNLLNYCDIITVKPWNVKAAGSKNNFNHYEVSDKKLHIKDYECAIKILEEKYPEYKQDIQEYNNSCCGYYTNIFIMRKNIFKQYCEWLFNILFEVEKQTNISDYDSQEARVFGYISEWLFGIYIYHLKRTTNLRIKELQRTVIKNTNIIQNNQNINICFASDNNYAQHLAVTIASLLMNSKTKKCIDIYILNDGNLEKKHKQNLKSLENLKNNTNIEFLTIDKSLFENFPIMRKSHFSQATYYRFIIPNLLNKINKLIYLDCDLVLNAGIEELYNIDIKDNYIGMVQDIIGKKNQMRLNLKEGKYYCNAGVLLLNLTKMREDFISKKLFEWTNNNKAIIKWQDQDVINVVMENKIYYLDLAWNLQHYPDTCMKDFDKKEFEIAKMNPKIVHYIGAVKPWNCKIQRLYGNLYFEYLKKTPYKNCLYKYYIKTFFYRILVNIFSIRTQFKENKIYKIITILGIKFMFRKKFKELQMKVEDLESKIYDISLKNNKSEYLQNMSEKISHQTL